MPGNHSLGTIRGTIEIDYDGAGIVKAIRDTDKAKESFGGFDGAASRVLGTLGRFAGGTAKAASLVSNLQVAVQAVAGALAIAGPLAAAAFAAAPGVILGGVSALIVMKVALAGVGDALKAAGGDAEKFEEAIKNLSPEAQKFARAYRAALPVLNQVGDAIQNAFFRGSDQLVGRVTGAIVSLRAQAVGVAGAMGRLAKEVVNAATSSRSLQNLRVILAGVNGFLLNIKGSIGPVISAFIGLAAQAAAFFGVVGGGLSGELLRFADFLNNIDLAALFETALPIVKSLGSFLADVGVILGRILSIFAGDGAEAAGVLAEMASQLRGFLESAQGQAVLDALGTALAAVGGAAGQVFLALLEALAPVIVALLPLVTTLANQVAQTLVPAIGAVAPLLLKVAEFLSANAEAVGPLVLGIAALAAGYKAYAIGVRLVVAAKKLELIANAKAAAGWIASTAAIVAQRVALVATTIAMNIAKAATIAWTVATKLLSAAWKASPIGVVITLLTLLVAGLIYAYRNSETFRKIVDAAWKSIRAVVAVVVKWFVDTALPVLIKVFKGIWTAVKMMVSLVIGYYRFWFNTARSVLNALISIFRTIINAIVVYVRAQFNLMRTIIVGVVNAIRTLWGNFLRGLQVIARTVWSAIVSVIRGAINNVLSVIRGIIRVRDHVRNAFNAARSAAANAISSLVNLVRGLPNRAASALGNLGNVLRAKGASLIQGFINGILSKLQSVRNAASNVVGAVTRFLPGSPAKEGPLSGRGYALLRARRMMADIARGISDQSHLPVAAMSGAVTPMVRPLVSGASTARTGASNTVSSPTTPRTFGPYNLVVDGKVISSIVIDTINGEPKIVAKAASEGSRQNSWTGSGRR